MVLISVSLLMVAAGLLLILAADPTARGRPDAGTILAFAGSGIFNPVMSGLVIGAGTDEHSALAAGRQRRVPADRASRSASPHSGTLFRPGRHHARVVHARPAPGRVVRPASPSPDRSPRPLIRGRPGPRSRVKDRASR